MAQWAEKYRPEDLEGVVGQDKTVLTLKSFIEQEEGGIHELPHFMFAGMPGVGKTATAVAFAKEMYGDEWEGHFMEYNASDERGIDVIRDEIKDIAKQQSLGAGKYRIVFLDECDRLTDEAQAALRRLMEVYSDNTKFILSCNHPFKLLDAIRERCVQFRFKPIDEETLEKYLVNICDQEDVDYREGALEYLAEKSEGSVRKALQTLQAISSVREINKEWVEHQLGAVSSNEVARIFQMTKGSGDAEVKLERVDEEIVKMYKDGKTPQEILSSFYDFIREEYPEMVKTLVKIGDIDSNIAQGSNPLLQLRCFMAYLVQRGD